MAVFEKEYQRRKVYLDDTQPLYCSFVNVQNIQGHTVSYCIKYLSIVTGHVFNRFEVIYICCVLIMNYYFEPV